METVDTDANTKSVISILLKKYGILGTLKVIWTDVLYDYRKGVNTFKPVASDNLFTADRASTQNRYVPSTFAVVEATLDLISDELNLEEDTFVDIGSGKGKVLIAAEKYGFNRVCGIEYTKNLHDIAQDNLKRLGIEHKAQSLNADASTHTFKDDEKVLYFFNPFIGKLLDDCIDNILASSAHSSRLIIYVNPVEMEKFDKVFEQLVYKSVQPGNVKVAIYRTKSESK